MSMMAMSGDRIASKTEPARRDAASAHAGVAVSDVALQMRAVGAMQDALSQRLDDWRRGQMKLVTETRSGLARMTQDWVVSPSARRLHQAQLDYAQFWFSRFIAHQELSARLALDVGQIVLDAALRQRSTQT